MNKTKPHHLQFEAIKENVTLERFVQSHNEKKKSNYFTTELKKALKYLIENINDKDTIDVNIDIIINKLKDAVKHDVKSEIIKENWRVS